MNILEMIFFHLNLLHTESLRLYQESGFQVALAAPCTKAFLPSKQGQLWHALFLKVKLGVGGGGGAVTQI